MTSLNSNSIDMVSGGAIPLAAYGIAWSIGYLGGLYYGSTIAKN